MPKVERREALTRPWHLLLAIDVLKAKHIIVSGHHGCSGVHAPLTGSYVGLADNWQRRVRDLGDKHENSLGDV